MSKYLKAICFLCVCLPTIALARGSLNLPIPTTLNGWASLLLIPIALISWRDLKLVSVLSIALLFSVYDRSFTPISYTVGSLVVVYVAIIFPFVTYHRHKETLKLEAIAKSEVKWIRKENGLQKINSIVFYPNEHFEVTSGKKVGVKILYPKPMFIFAEEIENFYDY
jgi:hypothetical protein